MESLLTFEVFCVPYLIEIAGLRLEQSRVYHVIRFGDELAEGLAIPCDTGVRMVSEIWNSTTLRKRTEGRGSRTSAETPS